jgi:cell division protease FtsH
LREQRPLLDALARLLLDQETVERDALQALVRAHATRSVSGRPAADDAAAPSATGARVLSSPGGRDDAQAQARTQSGR